MELAVVVVQSFHVAGNLGRVSRSAPDLDTSGREWVSFDLVRTFADVARLSEYDCAGHRKEVVGFEVIEVVGRHDAEVDGDVMLAVSDLRLPVAVPPLEMLSSA